jgi:predicted alpha/beta-hydrolase family hydrolase
MIDNQDISLVKIPSGSDTVLEGILGTPKNAKGIVLFAHGSGSGRHSPRNQYVAQTLHNAKIATLLIDLLTAEEEKKDLRPSPP